MMAIKMFLLLFAAILPSSVAEVFYVTPTTSANPSCSSPCHTLDQYAQDHTLFGGHTNITMVFLSGQHNLSYDLTISGVDELTMQGRKNCTHGNEILVNLQLVRIHLDVSTYLMIRDMTLRSRLVQQRIEISGPGIYISLLNLTLNLVAINIQRAFSVQINECKGLSTLYFANTTNINITNMDTLGNSSSPLKINGIEIDSQVQTTLMITNSTISRYWCGVYSMASTQVTISITNSKFKDNNYAIYSINFQGGMIITDTHFERNEYGIDVFSRYWYGVYSMASTQVTMSITNSQFKDNKFGIYIMNSEVGMIITDTHFERNEYAGIDLFGFQGHITITATQFRGNNYGIYGQGEMRISSNTQFNGNRIGLGVLANDSQHIVISNTHFKMNSFGVYTIQLQNLVILNSTVTDSPKFGILLINTNNSLLTHSYVLNNRAGITSVGSRVQVQNTSITNNAFGMIVPAVDLLFVPGNNAANRIQNCNFSGNNLSGLTLINSQEKVIIQDSIFNKNNGSSIFAYKSTFELIGGTVFRDNTANRGGALSLYNSTVTFGPGSNTQFVNNTALEYGGAIYVVSLPAIFPAILIDFENLPDEMVGTLLKTNGLLRKNCFFIAGVNMKVNFMRNKANLGGLDIYGPSLYTNDCSLEEEQFVFDTEVAQTLQVTSDPSRVCFCDSNYPQCTSTAFLVINKRKFPGESFSIPVVLTGYNFGRVAGTVYTNVVGLDYRDVINETQHVQSVSNIMNCTELQYNIFSHQSQIKFVMLTLTAQDQFTRGMREFETSVENFNSTRCTNINQQPCTAHLTTPVYINVTLKECPLGFELDNTTGTCECDRRINDLPRATCEIKDQTGFIIRKGTLWIGEDTRQNNTDLYYWHTNCPRDYCDRSETMVDLREPDTQCRLNRGGVLCGCCQNEYSLNLGSNKCTQCTDKTIALLILFAALGILLVVLIATLDLTVASGTINGLIFYANIVWVNNAILFSFQDIENNAYYIITLPIAWINLDFGIETCFSDKLDQLIKTGLQFVFPVYIWCIAGLIILICHYSTRATKLFGNNSVAVLATLFLLSFGKLFRNITDVLTYADLRDLNNTVHSVWALDGNVSYDDPRHIGLIVVALIFLFILLLFTVMILMVPFLISKSNNRLFRWINRLKPFFDTFYGPLKHSKRYQVWIGIMLFSRVVILITFASIPTNEPYANILLVIVIATLLQAYTSFVGLMYKKLYISLLEGSFLLNLIILGGAFLFCQTPPRNNSPESEENINTVSIISVSIVLLQLIGIVIFHIVRRVLTKQRLQECLKRESKPEEVSLDTDKDNPTVHVIDANEIYDSSRFRESLLA